MLKELKEAGYYVWMNDRNDLTAGQIPGWTESHATEIYYSGQKKQGPGNVNPDQRGEPGNKYYYSHYEGQLKCNAEGKNYNGDDEVVDAAIERIHNRPADQPLCMFLGLVYPHTPYRVEEPYFSTIDRAKLPKRVHADDCTGKPLMEAEIRKYAGMQDFTDADWDELRAVYLGMCMKIDVQFGKLVEALKEEGIYDDCAIFFLSDHGDFTGDFDLPEKAQNCFDPRAAADQAAEEYSAGPRHQQQHGGVGGFLRHGDGSGGRAAHPHPLWPQPAPRVGGPQRQGAGLRFLRGRPPAGRDPLR